MVDGNGLCAAAVAGHVARAIDAIAHLEASGGRTGGGNNACEFPAEQDPTAGFGAPHSAKEGFARVDANRANIDQNIGVAQCRLCHVDKLDREIFELLSLFVDERLHSQNLSFKLSRFPPTAPPT